MNKEEAFAIIDVAIKQFVIEKKALQKIVLDNKPKSDWFVFDYRKLSWEGNGLTKTIELYPELDNEANSTAWVLLASASYDEQSNRYHLYNKITETDSVSTIAGSFTQLLAGAFYFLENLRKEQIPFAVKIQ